MSAVPAPPAGLSRRSGKLWREVMDEFALSPGEVELLRNALVALDRADEAAAILAKEGLITVDRYGSPKAHPAADIESRNRTLYARFVSQLGVRATVERPTRRGKTGPKATTAPLRAVQ